MRDTYQIRKYLALAASLALSAGLLIGCSRSDSSRQDSAAGAGNTGINASGNVVAGAGSSSQAVQQETQSASALQAVSGTQDNAGAVQGTAASAGTATTPDAQNVSGTTTQTTQPQQTQQAGASSGQAAPAAPAAAAPAADTQTAQAASADEEDEGFNGSFEKSDGEEKVRITVESSDKIRFVFRSSMINGTAKITGNTAVYNGDDNYTITFDVAEDILMVTVDGEDAELSQMNGIYYRDYGDEDAEDEEAVFDGDETEEADNFFEDDADDTEDAGEDAAE